MAAQKKKSQEPKVTRISASDKPDTKPAASKKPAVTKVKAKATASKKTPTKKVAAVKSKPTAAKKQVADKPAKKPTVFGKILGYFKGAWYELTQVRWPNRRTTWGLTAAVIIFAAFFVGLVMLLDMIFGKLFNTLIG